MAAAHAAALDVKGVRDVVVRGRWMGRSLRLEVEGFMGEKVSLEAADRIGASVEQAILDAVPGPLHITRVPRYGPGT